MIFIKKILCKIGWHWLVEHKPTFWDRVAYKQVYNAWCKACGKKYMVDSKVPFLGFRCEIPQK